MTTTAEMSASGQREAKKQAQPRPRPRPRRPAPTNDNDGDEDSYEDAFDASLFLNEEYVSVSVPFGEEVEVGSEGEGDEEEGGDDEGGAKTRRSRSRSRFSLDLFCSQAASTDFDLTGQVLWPAAALLASYLVAGESGKGEEEREESSSRGRFLASASSSACELGAGLGLSGLAAVAFSGLKRLVLTDGSDVVLRVLERNANKVKELLAEKEKEKEKEGGGEEGQERREVSTFLLEWNDADAATALRTQHSFEGRGFDLLLGADVTYSLSALPALFATAAMLLKEEEVGEEEDKSKNRKPAPTFLLGYVSRSKALDRAVPLEAERAGFDVESVEGTRRRLPGGQEGWILCLTKKAKKNC